MRNGSGVLFVTRKFPPSVGGMQTLSAGVWRSLTQSGVGSGLIAHGGTNLGLIWWIPAAVGRLGAVLLRGRVGAVLTGDALVWAITEPLLRLARVERATMVMGLDVTYPGRIYRLLVHPALRRAPRVIAISAATAQEAVRVGVDPERLEILRLGVPAPSPSAPTGDRGRARAALAQLVGLDAGAVVLATLGRLVRRKGMAWFVAEVLPRLPPHAHYVVAGEGPEREAIRRAAGRAGVGDRVHILGRVDDRGRDVVLGGCDVFVQPNIATPGDLEGFGLVVVEAAMAGAPVVAARLEGISDAVVDQQTGYLVAPGDGAAWAAALGPLVADPVAAAAIGHRFASRAADLYGEEQMGRALAEILSRASHGSRT